MLERSQITMSPAELEAFLAEERVVTVASNPTRVSIWDHGKLAGGVH